MASSWGQLVDFSICDEVTVWPEGKGEQLWHSIFSTAGKKTCLLSCISNAGWTETWQWAVREAIREDPAWHFSHLDGVQASWITADRLAEQRRILPPLVYDRLWGDKWTEGAGDALQRDDIKASVVLTGPAESPEMSWAYFGGIDLAVRRDLAALVIVGKHVYTGRLRLACVMAWAPQGGKIDLRLVQKTALDLNGLFRPKWFFDPYQCELLAQNMAAAGAIIEPVVFVGSALVEMASGLVEVFSSRTIELYEDQGLLADLRRLRIVEGPSGWKLSATRTNAGHCDRATALSLAVLGARRSPLQDTAPTDMPFLAIPGWRGGQNAGGHQPIWLGGNRYHHW